MELRQLRYFVAVAEELNFSRAARRLCITQPPLSHQIRALERELGVELFIRGRTAELTEAGHTFLAGARHALEVADHAAQAARGAPRPLRVGYPASAVFELVPAALTAFQARFPATRLQIVDGHTAQHVEALCARKLDVAFIHADDMANGALNFRPLHSERLLLAMREDHPLAGLPRLKPQDLVDESIILFPRSTNPTLYDHLITEVFTRSGVVPNVVVHAAGMESTYSAVAAGVGVAFVAESTRRLLNVCAVAHRLLEPSLPMLRSGVAWRRDSTSKAVASFLGVIDQLAAAWLPVQDAAVAARPA